VVGTVAFLEMLTAELSPDDLYSLGREIAREVAVIVEEPVSVYGCIRSAFTHGMAYDRSCPVNTYNCSAVIPSRTVVYFNI
jgi:hypothetical protein